MSFEHTCENPCGAHSTLFCTDRVLKVSLCQPLINSIKRDTESGWHFLPRLRINKLGTLKVPSFYTAVKCLGRSGFNFEGLAVGKVFHCRGRAKNSEGYAFATAYEAMTIRQKNIYHSQLAS